MRSTVRSRPARLLAGLGLAALLSAFAVTVGSPAVQANAAPCAASKLADTATVPGARATTSITLTGCTSTPVSYAHISVVLRHPAVNDLGISLTAPGGSPTGLKAGDAWTVRRRSAR
jgi:hypothetical protein